MRAGKRLRLIPAHASTERRVAIVIEYQIGMTARTVQPGIYPALAFVDGGGDGHLRGIAIGVGGIGRYRFFVEALPQLSVRLTDMTLERVSAAGFVALESAPFVRPHGHMRYRLCYRPQSRSRGPAERDKQSYRREQHDGPECQLFLSFHRIQF